MSTHSGNAGRMHSRSVHDRAGTVAGTALSLLPLERAALAFARMRLIDLSGGEAIIREGDRGEQYFLLASGSAEVWRSDPLIGDKQCVAVLKAGSVFGEEALLIDGFRNASVIMREPGQVWALDKQDFDALIRPELVEGIYAPTARDLVAYGKAQWLDCRYEMEYAERHIPGALLLPLDRLRADIDMLDRAQTYIVYCRSGRRSICAAYLLRERGIKAYSLSGGVQAWPYETDGDGV